MTDDEVNELIERRTATKARGDYHEADQIRDTLDEAGITVEDYRTGTTWSRRRKATQ